ncbi:hypothetical protein BDQ94DRAFT_141288 [Aspergillus welwitschiae]|uniref:Uncharacterized protein n=1 Tax=Aspergillus welwitschiae TaxID=1341132 RepID=A0A3F3Q5E9_9EURO|nr:hypothetical protein BDQ94DRAFT_141288 [Aspergillus welwitschiae]RDH34325.1 hypothetical protein BDQ94DRAFT_141288 [Aspergillus welwitschiae]
MLLYYSCQSTRHKTSNTRHLLLLIVILFLRPSMLIDFMPKCHSRKSTCSSTSNWQYLFIQRRYC